MSKLNGAQKRKDLLIKYGPEHPTLVKHRERERLAGAKKRKRRAEANRELLNKLKANGCVDCGYKDLRALDFDHLPGHRKIREMSRMHDRSPSQVKAEVAKCEVVCSNCHRIRTHERQKAAGYHAPLRNLG